MHVSQNGWSTTNTPSSKLGMTPALSVRTNDSSPTNTHRESPSSRISSTSNVAISPLVVSPTATVFSSYLNLLKTLLGTGMLAMPMAFATYGILPALVVVFLVWLCATFGLEILGASARTVFFYQRDELETAGVIPSTVPTVAEEGDENVDVGPENISRSNPETALPQTAGVASGQQDELLLHADDDITTAPLISSLNFKSWLPQSDIKDPYLVLAGTRPPVTFTDVARFTYPQASVLFDLAVAIKCFGVSVSYIMVAADTLRVIFSSTITAAIVYIIVGVAGYISIGDAVGSNVVQSYPSSNHLALAAHLAIGLFALVSIPLQVYPCRMSASNIFRRFATPGSGIRLSGGEDDDLDGTSGTEMRDAVAARERREFVGLTSALLAAMYVVAAVVTRLDLVLAVVGATGSVGLCYM
ncbi:hypothetical protein HDU93_007686 [Gonapodya sp. JEL0774]|nr:hypothetical protein HDU93_007686 [Gonapodya sp. JEL0774]